MDIIAKIGDEHIAMVYVGRTASGHVIEFVESTPTYNLVEKWVLIVSSLNGCPVGCKMCDAGTFYRGKLSYGEIMEQIEYPISRRFPDGEVKTKKFKVQFARMGEPSFNPVVLEVMRDLGDTYENFFPSLSTVAPVGVDSFFEKLLRLKKDKFEDRFQLQFSIHSTNERMRDEIIPVRKWDFEKIARYGERFYNSGGLKITLNFALAKENIVDSDVVFRHFPEDKFLIKITPINPTVSVVNNKLTNDVNLRTGMPEKHRRFVEELKDRGYNVIISVGDVTENEIGSNCGMYILRYLKSEVKIKNAYTYVPEDLKLNLSDEA